MHPCDIGAYESQPIDVSVKTVSPPAILASTSVTANYAINLRNPGTADLTNVLVTDTLPSALTYVDNSLSASSGVYGYSNGIITWNGTVNTGGMVTITFRARVSPTIPSGTFVANTAQINVGGIVLGRTANVYVASTMIFLPVLVKNNSYTNIYGYVTQSGTAVGGVPLELRFYNGSAWSTLATTTTAPDGKYIFLAPPLSSGQAYYVRYLNSGTYGRLSFWDTRVLTTFTAASDVLIGNFDLDDIALTAPSPGATVALPYTFQWNRRTATPSDSYEFDLFDPYTGSPWWYTAPLGYVGSYTLTGLPSGFSTNKRYCWAVGVYGPDGGYGMSYYCYIVQFANTGNKPAPQAPAKPGSVFSDLPRQQFIHKRP